MTLETGRNIKSGRVISNDYTIYTRILKECRPKIDITLVAVASNNIPSTIESLLKCMELIEFPKVKFITHKLPKNLPKDIEYINCPELNYKECMEYYFLELGKHIDTSHCLVVQHDSWILRPQMWNNDWLNFDYIAPLWPNHHSMLLPTGEYVRVGCGGFSLRSKLFLDLPRTLNLPLVEYTGYPCNSWADDWNACVYYRDTFIKNNIKYAPENVAAEFGQEVDVGENIGVYPFGFHKYIH